MKYIRLNEKREVAEIFPYDPFKYFVSSDGTPNNEILANCRKLKNNVKVEYGWIEQSDGSFVPPETISANEAAFAPVSLETEPEISALTVDTPQEPVKTLTLKFKVDNQKLSVVGSNDISDPRVIADSVNYLYIQFEFSPEWEEMKFAIFHNWWGRTKVKLENDGCYVPSRYIEAPKFGLSVYCITSDGRLITTKEIQIYVGKSGYAKGELPPLPPPPLSTPIYSPSGEGKVQQFRVMDGLLEYTTDGETWHRASGGSIVYLGKKEESL